MRIEEYFLQIRKEIEANPVVRLVTITEEKRGTYEGFLEGELTFLDKTTLHFREYVDVEDRSDRLMYSYHYTAEDGRLIFRYDNTGHHRKLKLSTYPHHKHDGDEERVVVSPAPTLVNVLDEIQGLVKLP
ncbi:MAG: DUF6516 family protein [Chloroflexota bacterium]